MENAVWEELSEGCSEEVFGALRRLRAFYDGRAIAEWLARLYDPEIGGFYYSNSARDTEGYLPDLESTEQALSLMASNGGYVRANDVLPDAVKARIVRFVQSMQSPEDGVFYHPQWPKGKDKLQNDRWGRDLGSAAALLGRLLPYGERQYPLYCTPSGLKCRCHEGTNEVCFRSDVGGEKPQSPSVPDYSSREAFWAWLCEYDRNILNNSGRAHNLAALRNEIVAQGYGDVLIDFLDQNLRKLFREQIESGALPTGAWQSEYNYHLIWGVWKHLYIYNCEKCRRPFPLEIAPYTVRSCIKILLQRIETPHAMNDLFNQWVSIHAVISNIRLHYGEAEAKRLHEIVREHAVELIDATIAKTRDFRNDDGTVVYRSTGLGMTTIYGVPIAEGVREGDVNGVALWCALYNGVFNCLGYPIPRIMNESDGARFIELLRLAKSPMKKAKGEKT